MKTVFYLLFTIVSVNSIHGCSESKSDSEAVSLIQTAACTVSSAISTSESLVTDDEITEHYSDEITSMDKGQRYRFYQSFRGLTKTKMWGLHSLVIAMGGHQEIFDAFSFVPPHERLPIANFVKDKIDGMDLSTKSSFIRMFRGLTQDEMTYLCLLMFDYTRDKTYDQFLEEVGYLEPSQKLPIVEFMISKASEIDKNIIHYYLLLFEGFDLDQVQFLYPKVGEMLAGLSDKFNAMDGFFTYRSMPPKERVVLIAQGLRLIAPDLSYGQRCKIFHHLRCRPEAHRKPMVDQVLKKMPRTFIMVSRFDSIVALLDEPLAKLKQD